MSTQTLDAAIFPALDELRERSFPSPEALFLLGTGVGTLPSTLGASNSLSLSKLPGVPACWSGATLFAGRLNGLDVWLLDDAPGGLQYGESDGGGTPAWARAYPCWLARAAGAHLCVTTAAGIALRPTQVNETDAQAALGSLALIKDHINLSGRTPLSGLGETRLGPLFPDQTRLFDAELREKTLERAAAMGLDVVEAVVACTIGPALDTPAELRWLASTGAQVAAQGLADPLIACAHAGLSVLGVVAITDLGDTPLEMPELLARAESLAPALEDLLSSMAPEFAAAAQAAAQEEL